jgi:hypothetical protein
MFNTEGVGTLMFYFHTEVQTPDSDYLFLTVLKAKTKQNCHMAAGLLLYILHKYYLTNIFMFSSKVITIQHFGGVPTSKLCASIMLLLRCTE